MEAFQKVIWFFVLFWFVGSKFGRVCGQNNAEEQSLTELIETEEEENLWLEDESPPWYVDLFFGLLITFVHLWYAYHFTDYSLRNIHRQGGDEEEAEEGEEEDSEGNETDENGIEINTNEKKRKSVRLSATIPLRSEFENAGFLARATSTKNRDQKVVLSTQKSRSRLGGITGGTGSKSVGFFAPRAKSVHQNKSHPKLVVAGSKRGSGGMSIDAGGAATKPLKKGVRPDLEEKRQVLIEKHLAAFQTTGAAKETKQQNAHTNELARQLSHFQDDIHDGNKKITRSTTVDGMRVETFAGLTTEDMMKIYGLPRKNPCCLFFTCCTICTDPRIFSWERTYFARLGLQLYISLSCCLALVLYIEFFGNLFVEFIITCIVHYKDYYYLGLIILPALIYCIEIIFRIGMHSVLIAWKVNCDINGDIEAINLDVQVNIDDLLENDVDETTGDAKQLKFSKHFNAVIQYSYRIDTLTTNLHHEYEQETRKRVRTNSRIEPVTPIDEAEDLVDADYDTEEESIRNSSRRVKFDNSTRSLGGKGNSGMKLALMNSVSGASDGGASGASGDEAGGAQGGDGSQMLKLKGDKQPKSQILSQSSMEYDDEIDASMRQKVDQAIEMFEDLYLYNVNTQDYFMATCWRLWFLLLTVLWTFVGSLFIGETIAVSSFFYALLMRNCVMGAISWTLVYAGCSIYLGFRSRWKTWHKIQDLERWNCLCLLDAADDERAQTGHRGWRNFKVIVVTGLLVSSIACFFANIFLDVDGFLIFIALVFIFYYIGNLYFASKPGHLYALWKDAIPAPSINYYAHERASMALCKAEKIDKAICYMQTRSKSISRSRRTRSFSSIEDARGKARDRQRTSSNLSTLHMRDSSRSTNAKKSQMIAEESLEDDLLQRNTSRNSVQISFTNVKVGNLTTPRDAAQSGSIIPSASMSSVVTPKHEDMPPIGGGAVEMALQTKFTHMNTNNSATLEVDAPSEIDASQSENDGVNRENFVSRVTSRDSARDEEPETPVIDGEKKRLSAVGTAALNVNGANGVMAEEDVILPSEQKRIDERRESVSNAKQAKEEGDMPEDAEQTAADKTLEAGFGLHAVAEEIKSDNEQEEAEKKRKKKNKELEIVSIGFGMDMSKPMNVITNTFQKIVNTPQQIQQFQDFLKQKKEAAIREERELTEKFRSEKQIFENKRLQKLIARYQSFEFEYKLNDIYKQDNEDKFCPRTRRQWYGFSDFWTNYENYWLNVYRPFDEYDMEANEESHKIMHGMKWMKPCIDCELYCCLSREDRVRQEAAKAQTPEHLKVNQNKSWAETFKKRYQLLVRFCQYLLDNTCNVCLFAVLCIIIVAIFYLSSSLTSATTGDDKFNSWFDIKEANESDTSFYSICTTEFQPYPRSASVEVPESAKFTCMDLMFLMQAAYEMDNSNLTQMIDLYFNGTMRIVGTSYYEPVWFHIEHVSAPISILSVRGTSSLVDALQDLSLFVEVLSFEGLQWIFPFLNALSTSFIRRIIYYSSLPEGLINEDARSRFDDPVYKHASAYLTEAETSDITLNSGMDPAMYIVGHSLGGAVAQIVAARLYADGREEHIGSVGMSSPGTLFSSAKFGYNTDDLDITSNSILPRRDIVSKIDQHGGNVQEVSCNADNLLSCHYVETVICEIYSNCPSASQRVDTELFDCYCWNSNTGDSNKDFKFGHCMNVTYPDHDIFSITGWKDVWDA